MTYQDILEVIRMAVVAYIRVSSTGQSLEVQRQLVEEFGVDKIFAEKVSGTTQNRPKLQECLQYVREGDTLVITKLDRLARSVSHLHQIVDDLTSRGVGFKVLQQNIDTTTKEGRLMFSVLGALAQFENELRKERCEEGRQAAVSRGVKFGAPKKLSGDQVAEMRQKRESGVLIKDLMNEYGLSKASVYRLMAG
jgi:DNA invertase Pin-like site-specific DNA recombinase